MQIRHIFPAKIVYQLLLILIPLVVLPIIVLGTILIENGKGATRTAVLRDYEEIAKRAAKEIDMLVDRSQIILISMASTVRVPDEAWKLQNALISLQNGADAFQNLTYYDTNGRIISTGDLSHERPEKFTNDVRAAIKLFKMDPAEKIYQSSVFYLEYNIPAVTMVTPIRWANEMEGVLAAQVDFHEMWDVVKEITVGKNSIAYVVSKDGSVIAHHDLKIVMNAENRRMLAPVENVLKKVSGSLNYTNPAGIDFLSAYAPLEKLDWGVIFEQPASEAYATIETMQRQAERFILFSAFIALVIGILAARSIVQPVLRLVEGTRRISQGDLSHQIELKQNDEIGQLALSFNEMAKSLKESYEGLESKVTERTSQLRHALEEVERLNALKSKFVSEVAHELRTPMTSIQGFADTLLRLQTKMPKEKQIECVQIISNESIRLTRLVNDLLDLSRIESGGIQLKMIPTDVLKTAQAAIQAAEQPAMDKNIQIISAFPETISRVEADQDALRRIFDNLIGNGLKFTPEGGFITVDIRNGNQEVRVQITDTGIGIPDNQIEHIFEPFFRVKASGDPTIGTGLGLPIVKSLVEEHGGKINATSTPGQGSVFSFTLPVIQDKESPHGPTKTETHSHY